MCMMQCFGGFATVLASKVGSVSASEHRASKRSTVPAEQGRKGRSLGNTCGGAPHSTTRLGPQGETRGFKPWTKKIKVLTFPSPSKNLDAWRPDRADSQRLLAGALRRCRCLWLMLTSWGTLACKVRRCSHAGVPGWTPGGVAWEPAPWRDKLGALRDMSSTLSQSVCWRTQHNPRLGPDRLMRRAKRGKR